MRDLLLQLFTLEDGTDSLSQKGGKKLPHYSLCYIAQKSAVLMCFAELGFLVLYVNHTYNIGMLC
jgi:hypothetical protein